MQTFNESIAEPQPLSSWGEVAEAYDRQNDHIQAIIAKLNELKELFGNTSRTLGKPLEGNAYDQTIERMYHPENFL